MLLRRATLEDLPGLLRLYVFLNPKDRTIDAQTAAVRQHWQSIVDDPRLRYYVMEIPASGIASASKSGALISTCTLTLIPNLTRELRPYGVIENVVTDPAHRGKGHGTRLLRLALDEAWGQGCYKVMLSTGSKREETLRFYERAGFRRGVKTGFIAYPGDLGPP